MVKRRARGSNPQPVSRHDISNVAASHSLTLQGSVFRVRPTAGPTVSRIGRWAISLRNTDKRRSSISPKQPRKTPATAGRFACSSGRTTRYAELHCDPLRGRAGAGRRVARTGLDCHPPRRGDRPLLTIFLGGSPPPRAHRCFPAHRARAAQQRTTDSASPPDSIRRLIQRPVYIRPCQADGSRPPNMIAKPTIISPSIRSWMT